MRFIHAQLQDTKKIIKRNEYQNKTKKMQI